jgi:hypothetical protein
MSTLMQITSGSWIPWVGLALSVIAASVYFIIASPARPADYKSPPIPVLVVAGLAYLIGGVLILLGDRRLLIFGALVNPLVMAAFAVAARTGHATIDRLSVTSKVAQLMLEVLLLWLIVQPAQATIELA